MGYNVDVVFCPLIDDNIEDIDCIKNRDCVDGMIKISCLPDIYKNKENFIEICKKCKWHNY